MALIQCKECGQSVSTEAAACPHCGAPQQQSAPPPLPVQPMEETILSRQRRYCNHMCHYRRSDLCVAETLRQSKCCSDIAATRKTDPVSRRWLDDFVCRVLSHKRKRSRASQCFCYCRHDDRRRDFVDVQRKNQLSCWPFSSVSGEIHALSSKNKAYIERVVLSINEAIVKLQ